MNKAYSSDKRFIYVYKRMNHFDVSANHFRTECAFMNKAFSRKVYVFVA